MERGLGGKKDTGYLYKGKPARTTLQALSQETLYTTLPKRSIDLHQACLKVLYYDIMDARFSYLSHLEWE